MKAEITLGDMLLGFGLMYLVTRDWKEDAHAFAKEQGLEPSLPSGARLPGSGKLREVPKVQTRLDWSGFPQLFNQAAQIVERETFGLEELVRDWVNLSPAVPEPSDDYENAAKVFATQADVESDGGRAVYHYNMGNLTVATGDYFLNPSSDTAHKYGVYLYPLQGAVAMLALIKRRWPEAYKTAYLGPFVLDQYAAALKPANAPQYYEAPLSRYQEALKARARQRGWLT
jgi:hypothetical protein